MAASPKRIALLLRLNAKSFEQINSLRLKYPSVQLAEQILDPQRPLLPYLALLRTLPRTPLPILQERTAKLASHRKPFSIKVGAATLTERRRGDASPPTYGFGFELPLEEIEQLRREIYGELSAEIKGVAGETVLSSHKSVYKAPTTKPMLLVRNSYEGLPEEQASKVLRELKEQYPDGFGTIGAEAFALQEIARYSRMGGIREERMRGGYPFGSN